MPASGGERRGAHPGEGWDPSCRRTNSQLLTLPRGSGMYGWLSSCRQSPSTMNLYWWYLRPPPQAATLAPAALRSGELTAGKNVAS